MISTYEGGNHPVPTPFVVNATSQNPRVQNEKFMWMLHRLDGKRPLSTFPVDKLFNFGDEIFCLPRVLNSHSTKWKIFHLKCSFRYYNINNIWKFVSISANPGLFFALFSFFWNKIWDIVDQIFALMFTPSGYSSKHIVARGSCTLTKKSSQDDHETMILKFVVPAFFYIWHSCG